MTSPSSSGTYTQTQYALDDYLGEALSRIGIRSDQINADHITEATRSANLMLASWAADGFKQYDLQLVTLSTEDAVNGVIDYSYFPYGTLQIFSGIIRVNSTFDVPMVRISRYDYEQIPYKSDMGRPDRFFWDGLGNQLSDRYMQLWPWPNPANIYDLRIWCICRAQDVGTLVNSPDIGFEWIDAFSAGLAARLARKYRPDIVNDMLVEAGGPGIAGGAYQVAKTGERERGPSRFRVDYRTRESPR